MAHIERPQAHPWSVAKNERGACGHPNCEAPMTAIEFHPGIPGIGIAHVHYCAAHAAWFSAVRDMATVKITAPIGKCPSCGVADWDGQPCMRCGRHPEPKR
ncbi:MAG: hypothetical protein ACRENL_01825 [Candidatus Dormibacteria bacterium]